MKKKKSSEYRFGFLVISTTIGRKQDGQKAPVNNTRKRLHFLFIFRNLGHSAVFSLSSLPPSIVKRNPLWPYGTCNCMKYTF